MIFHDSTEKKSFSKHQNKVEFKNLDDSEVLSSDFPGPRTSAASLTSSASAASLASTASKALFHKKKSWSWWLDHPWHQNYQCGPLFVEWILKIQFFTDIWYFFCWRLLRPAVIIFLKNGCGTQKFPISAFQNHLQTKFNLHIFIRQAIDDKPRLKYFIHKPYISVAFPRYKSVSIDIFVFFQNKIVESKYR